jgi:hypothetical protein
MERRALAAVIIAVVQGRRGARQQRGKARLALDQRQRAHILAVEMQKVEDEEHEPGRFAGIRRGLDHAERGNAVRKDAAQFAVEVSLARTERRHGRGDRRVFMGPVEPGASQKAHRAAVEARMHAVTVEFDLMQPLIAFGSGLDELGELRRDPGRQRGGA